MHDDEKEDTHPSYGLVGISRVTNGGSGGGVTLVGSPIKHQTSIRLRVWQAKHVRSLSADRFYRTESLPLLELEMSETQFARFITAPNIGDGEVCTLRYIRTGPPQDLPSPPKMAIAETFRDELRESVAKSAEQLKALRLRVEELFSDKKTVKVKDREDILKSIKMCQQQIEANVPFVLHQLEEQLDAQVSAAKTKIDAFLQQRVRQLGISTPTIVEGESVLSLPEPEAK